MMTNSIRPTDGFIFKSDAARRVFVRTWDTWSQRFGVEARFPEHTAVIGNAVDLTANVRSEALRAETRRLLKMSSDDTVFLSFSRLSWGTKGDQLALVARWGEVAARWPKAKLIVAVAAVDRHLPIEMGAALLGDTDSAS